MAIGYVMLYTNSNILCSICTKLHMFDKCAGMNTSTCQYPVIVIAPPAGSRKFGRYKWLWHIPPVFITWNAYCSPFIDFLKPPLAVSPGARARSLLLAALIIIIIFFFSRFWGVLGPLTYTKTLENSHTRWNPRPSGRRRGWDPGVAQGLYGAPWNTVWKLDV